MTDIRDRVKELRRVRAGDLVPNPKNWRRHPKAQIAALQGVLAEIGYADALLARETPAGLQLVDGHARASLDPEQLVPVLILDVDEAEADKLLLTLDPLAAMAKTSAESLGLLLKEVQSDDQGVKKMLEQLALDSRLPVPGREGLTNPDAIPEPPAVPRSQRGDLWMLGAFYLCDCGARNELPTLRQPVRADPLQPEVLQRSMPPGLEASDQPALQARTEGSRDGATLASEPGEGQDRQGLSRDGQRTRNGGSQADAPGADALLPDEEAPQGSGELPSTQDGSHRVRRGMPAMRQDDGSDAGSRSADVPRRSTRASEPPGALPFVQRREEATNHPLCRHCGRQLTAGNLTGQHKILCGDSTDAGDVARLFGELRASLMSTDPPYLVNYTGNTMGESHPNNGHPVKQHPEYIEQNPNYGQRRPTKPDADGIWRDHQVGTHSDYIDPQANPDAGDPREAPKPRTGRRDWTKNRADIPDTEFPDYIEQEPPAPAKNNTTRRRTPLSHSQRARGATEPGESLKHWDDYIDPEQSVDFYTAFLKLGVQYLKPGSAVYQWHATKRQDLVMDAWTAAGLWNHQTIVWVKPRATLTRADYMWQSEPAFFGWIDGYEPAFYGWFKDRRPEKDHRPPAYATNVWTIAGEHDNIHPTQKPVEIFARPIEYHTNPGDVVYEPFSGSGTQLIAAQRLGRRCFAMELAPAYVDVAVKRWEAFTGQTAALERPE